MKVSNNKCARCGAYLFDDDDVVYCPDCGAPHHRTCYLDTGHCALEDKHGTPDEYKKPSDIPEVESENESHSCPACGKSITEDTVFCPYCRKKLKNESLPEMVKHLNNGAFDGIDEKEVIEGISAKEIMLFVFVNPIRYLRKFREISAGRKISWNWLAFLLPTQWFFLRKMYKNGLFVFLLELSSLIMMFPFAQFVNSLYFAETTGYLETGEIIMRHLPDFSSLGLILLAFGTLINLCLRVLCAIYGDLLYKNYAFIKIKKFNDDSDRDSADTLNRVGGVNILAFFAAYIVCEYFPGILMSLIL